MYMTAKPIQSAMEHTIDTSEGVESLTVGLVVGGPTNNPVLTYLLKGLYSLSIFLMSWSED